LAGACLSAVGQPAPQSAAQACGDSVLAFYDQGPNFANVAQVYPDHAKYLAELLKQGKVAAAGRMKEGTKALMIVRTKDPEEAKRWVNQDPFVQKGVVNASFMVWGHCWSPGTAAPDFEAPAPK